MSFRNGFRRRGSRRDSALDTARTSFALLVKGPDPIAIDGSLFPDFPRELVPLDRVRELLLERECPQATRDAVWAYLVERARAEGGAWTVGCVGVAMPALRALANGLTARFADDASDVHAEVLVGFLGELARVDTSQPWIMSRLRWAAFRAGRAAVREALDSDVPAKDGFRSQEPPSPWRHPDFVLLRAVAENVITEDEADLIGVTRLEEVDLHVYAADRGLDYNACKSARLRAEYRLVDYLLDPDSGGGLPDEDDDGITDRVATAMALARATRGRRTRPRTVTSAARTRSQKIRKSLHPNGPETGVLECGEKPPTATPAPTSEVPRCA